MRTLAFLVFALVVSPALAHTMRPVDFQCPLCSEKFSQVMDMSGTQFGQRLDLKPIGPTAAPWAVPQCPSCKFILLRDDDKYSPEELTKLKTFVAAAPYRDAAKSKPNYFLLALLTEELKRPLADIAFAYLQASWEMEDGSKEQAAILERTLAAYRAALANKEDLPSDLRPTFQMIVGECLRRLGKFSEAKSHFTAMKKTAKADPTLERIVTQELRLIAARDSKPHEIEWEGK